MADKKDIVSVTDLSEDDIATILALAADYKAGKYTPTLNNKIIANCFFEPSTRTRLSFESAAQRLGAKVIGFSDSDNLSLKKGESLSDTIRVISSYADAVVIRHPSEGSARLAANLSDKPVINAGDGANQHPTQALLDLFSIKECVGKLDDVRIAFAGDLKHGRTVHSLLQLTAAYKMRIYFVATEALQPDENLCQMLKRQGVKFSFHRSLAEVMPKLDILYMTRVQKERFRDYYGSDIDNPHCLTPDLLSNVKESFRILHPLPRVNEIDKTIDNTPYAYYFEQAANGVFIRMALLQMLLGD